MSPTPDPTGQEVPSWEEDQKLNRRILIEGGEFLMGSPEDVGESWEHPQHRVRLSPYYIQQHLVTNEEYERFDPKRWYPRGTHLHPVVNLTWHQATAYAEWLGGNLPTEAQWEFAARGTEGRTYPWGDESPGREHANYRGGYGRVLAAMLHPKGATPEGVLGMAGNVWEWCREGCEQYPAEEQEDPLGPDTWPRVTRGGSWKNNPYYLRAAYREPFPPGAQIACIGFRVVWPSPGS